MCAWPGVSTPYWIMKYELDTHEEMLVNTRILSQSYERITLYDVNKTPLEWKGREPLNLEHAITVNALHKS